MEFQYYPADVQTCEIKLESFGYTNRQMKFSWMKSTVWIFKNTKGPFIIQCVLHNFYLVIFSSFFKLMSTEVNLKISWISKEKLLKQIFKKTLSIVVIMMEHQVCKWKPYACQNFHNCIPFLLSDGSNINQNISLPQFDLRVNFGDNYATDYYNLSYPGVIMRIVLSRKMSFHLWQTYIPSSIFVVVAWLSTFVPPEEEKSCKY